MLLEVGTGQLASDSIRGLVAAKWQTLGLAAPCNVGDNGVHASASPFEALAECTNWLESGVSSEPFGKRMLAAGPSRDRLLSRAAWRGASGDGFARGGIGAACV